MAAEIKRDGEERKVSIRFGPGKTPGEVIEGVEKALLRLRDNLRALGGIASIDTHSELDGRPTVVVREKRKGRPKRTPEPGKGKQGDDTLPKAG